MKNAAALYESVVQEVTKKLETCEKRDRSKLLLGLITQLKQICNHPANFDSSLPLDSQSSGKSKLLMEILENIINSKEKVGFPRRKKK